MLSEIDRTKTFVLIKSINEFFWSRFPWSANHFSSRIEEWKKYFLRVETWLPEILSFLRSLSLPRLSIKGKKNWISGFRDWQRVFRFNDEFLVLGKNCVKCFRVANSNTFSCKFSKTKFLKIHKKKKRNKANNNRYHLCQIFQFHQNIVLIFLETLQTLLD